MIRSNLAKHLIKDQKANSLSVKGNVAWTSSGEVREGLFIMSDSNRRMLGRARNVCLAMLIGLTLTQKALRRWCTARSLTLLIAVIVAGLFPTKYLSAQAPGAPGDDLIACPVTMCSDGQQCYQAEQGCNPPGETPKCSECAKCPQKSCPSNGEKCHDPIPADVDQDKLACEPESGYGKDCGSCPDKCQEVVCWNGLKCFQQGDPNNCEINDDQ